MTTPMMVQFNRMKKEFPKEILFFRMGDFYEMFGDDAITAAPVLDIALTSRDKGKGLPMCGIPHHSVEPYIHKLLRAGHKVAICEQLTDPKQSKGIVERGVVRVVTPGTLTDDTLLESKANNFLAAVATDKKSAGIAWVDVSTGRFQLLQCAVNSLTDALLRIAPSECLCIENWDADKPEWMLALERESSCLIVSRPEWEFDEGAARKKLCEHFQTHSLQGFGVDEQTTGIQAAGAVLAYLTETQRTRLDHIRRIELFRSDDRLIMDVATCRSLELVRTIRSGERRGSLLHVLDHTRTAMGARLLQDWVTAPLTDIASIHRRQDAVSDLVESDTLRDNLQENLKAVSDMERIIARVSCMRASARDLSQLQHSLDVLPSIRESLQAADSQELTALHDALDPLQDLNDSLRSALVDRPPFSVREGGMMRDGYHAELDEIRGLQAHGKEWMANFQAEEIERTGINNLKIGFNKVFGFYIEISHVGARSGIPEHYIRKQTLKNAERYITPELKEYETKVLHADERGKALEYDLFVALREATATQMNRILETAKLLATLDCFSSLAQVARFRNYVKPEVDDSGAMCIVGGRHPVLDILLEQEDFIPNDIDLDIETARIAVITGPNMAGKSTYIRQIALLALMAQMGSYLPAEEARIGIVDKIFTRVGASDEIARGESTFMVEMSETANILNNATHRSLVILDEVGRGTSTFDGLSLAWAITEYLYHHNGCRALFATHYHQLSDLAELFPGIRNFHVAVKEWGEQIVFLRKVVAGGTDKSYGLHVARLAGIPGEVLDRARGILESLELENEDLLDRARHATGSTAPMGGTPPQYQMTLFHPPADPVLEELKTLLQDVSPDDMTPLQALQLIHDLKSKIEDSGKRS